MTRAHNRPDGGKVDVQIKEVVALKDLEVFVRFPHNLYQGHPYWVPALDSDEKNTLRHDRNPAFDHCDARYWLAYLDGRIAGRVAAIRNRLDIEKRGQPYLRFGWIDFVDDQGVSQALLGAVEEWAENLGMTAVHGPLGFTDLDREGMLVEGFDEIATLSTTHNYPYYGDHMARLGYEKDVDWLEHEIALPAELDQRVARVAATAMRRLDVRLLEVRSRRELLPYAAELFDVLNAEYRHLYGVVPLTQTQVDAYVKQYFGFIHPDFVPVVLDRHGQMIAFTIAMPSLSRALQKAKGRLFPLGFAHLLSSINKNDRVDLYIGAVRSEYQGWGVNAIMMQRMFDACRRHGIKTIHANPQLETNRRVLNQWKYFQARQHKRRRVFIKHLAPGASTA
jgi:GNAT superfamily N-acetyltransferase